MHFNDSIHMHTFSYTGTAVGRWHQTNKQRRVVSVILCKVDRDGGFLLFPHIVNVNRTNQGQDYKLKYCVMKAPRLLQRSVSPLSWNVPDAPADLTQHYPFEKTRNQFVDFYIDFFLNGHRGVSATIGALREMYVRCNLH